MSGAKRWTRWGERQPAESVAASLKVESLEGFMASNRGKTDLPEVVQVRNLRDAFKVSALSMVVQGAIPYGVPTEPLYDGTLELYAPGCFRASLQTDDVRGLVNFDPSKVIGRKDAGTLRIWDDMQAVRLEIDMPDTTYGCDTLVSMRRGDIDSLGLAFVALAYEWRMIAGERVRAITEASLIGVSIVTWGILTGAGAKLVTSAELEATRNAGYQEGLKAAAQMVSGRRMEKSHVTVQ